MKSVPENIEHRIQLKEDEISRYRAILVNYPLDRLERSGIPYLTKLQDQLNELYAEQARQKL
jgi:hypothetical protein